jgi:anti-sigma regulatory factor (Ser/Thr protein kinase)
LDFSACDKAYPGGMLPIVCSVDALRARDIGFTLVLPELQMLSRLFLNCNWAHLLDPEHFEELMLAHERHLAVRRYTEWREQQDVVNAAMDVVMRNMELTRDVLSGLEWSMNEITDNVLNHAEAEQGGFIQVSTFKENHQIAFVVADAGRGILASMQEGFPGLRSDEDALGEAVKAGVTRNSDAGQGNGLAGTLRIAVGSGGSFKLTSGRAQLEVIRPPGAEEFKEHVYPRSRRLAFDGTVVSAELGTDGTFSLEDALGGDPRIEHGAWDIIDSAYASDVGDHLTLHLAEESIGFGTRQGAEQLRTKVKNLLNAEPGKRLVIDWTGVPLVSSSFADELFGRLFLELGPLGFASRLQSVGMEPLVRSLVDRAVLQRIRQTGVP